MHNNTDGTDIKSVPSLLGVLNFDTVETKKKGLFTFYTFGVIIN